MFFCLLVVVSFLIGEAIVLCFCIFSRDKSLTCRVGAHYWARFLFLFLGSRVIVSGLENLPRNQPVILAANHQSAADIPILLSFIPIYFRFVVKKELFYIPIFGWHIQRSGYLYIDRNDLVSALKLFKAMVKLLKAGGSVLIFPEGTRSRDGSLGKFKRGSLRAAKNSGAPIIPIAISGAFDIVRRGSWIIHPATIRLNIGKPVYITSEDEYEQKEEEVRESIAKLL